MLFACGRYGQPRPDFPSGIRLALISYTRVSEMRTAMWSLLAGVKLANRAV